jgi:hypothetical protein
VIPTGPSFPASAAPNAGTPAGARPAAVPRDLILHCTASSRRSDAQMTEETEARVKGRCVHCLNNHRMLHTTLHRPIPSTEISRPCDKLTYKRRDHLADPHRLVASHPPERWVRLGTSFQFRCVGLEKPHDPKLLRQSPIGRYSALARQAFRWMILSLWYGRWQMTINWNCSRREHGTDYSCIFALAGTDGVSSLAECLLGGVSGREIRVLPPKRRAGAHDGRISL